MNIRNLAVLFAFILPTVPALATTVEPIETVRVYKADGSLQCEAGKGASLAETRKELEALGAKVRSAEKRTLPGAVIQLCGSPTGRVNSYVVERYGWLDIVQGPARGGGFERWVFDDPFTEIYKHDGSLQCEKGGGIPPADMRKELEATGVRILAQRKDRDGLIRITQCGSPTGNVNVFTIPPEYWPAAKALGYTLFER